MVADGIAAPRLALVAPPQIAAHWAELRGRLDGACARSGGKYQAGDVLQLLLAGRMQLWAVVGEEIEAIVLTEIADYPRRRLCRVLAAVGAGRARWVHLLGTIEDWARGQGCTAIEPVARPGWERALAPLGYRKTHVILEKEL